MFVDVHSHLTHEDFASDLAEVIARAEAAQLSDIVVNGLDPWSNRRILELAHQYQVIKPALGIYPIDAIQRQELDLPFKRSRFDIEDELQFIEASASQGLLHAIGECGLDGYWVGEETFQEQETVFCRLIEIAVGHNLPLIIHTRKREERAMEILAHHGVKRVDFHCYGGKVKLALRAAEQHGWYFSIPANARNNEAFRKLLKELPKELVLTETDCPYLAPEKGARNEPKNVVQTVELLAELRSWDLDQAKTQVYENYCRLFTKA